MNTNENLSDDVIIFLEALPLCKNDRWRNAAAITVLGIPTPEHRDSVAFELIYALCDFIDDEEEQERILTRVRQHRGRQTSPEELFNNPTKGV